MKLYLMYGLIFLIIILFFIIIKDKIKALRITSIITMSTSVILVILSFIIKLVIKTTVTNINLSWITNYLLLKFITTSLILFVIGVIELIISKLLSLKRNVIAN